VARRRRTAPVSTLRASLNRRFGASADAEKMPGLAEEEARRPFFLLEVLQSMHRFLLPKTALAVVLVLLVALTLRFDFPWGAPLVKAAREVAGRDFDLRALATEVVPVVKKIGQEWKLLREWSLFSGGSPAPDPVAGRLQSGFELRRHPVTGAPEMHYGIDLLAPEGSPVTAVLEGEVVEVAADRSGTATVLLKHDADWQTVYRGLEEVDLEPGDRVEKGRQLGVLGSSRLWELPHLHFELRYRGRPVAPPPEWLAQFRSRNL